MLDKYTILARIAPSFIFASALVYFVVFPLGIEIPWDAINASLEVKVAGTSIVVVCVLFPISILLRHWSKWLFSFNFLNRFGSTYTLKILCTAGQINEHPKVSRLRAEFKEANDLPIPCRNYLNDPSQTSAVDILDHLVERTRDDKIKLVENIIFGFSRNLFGGFILIAIVVLALSLLDYIWIVIYNPPYVLIATILILGMGILFWLLHKSSVEYTERLFKFYLS